MPRSPTLLRRAATSGLALVLLSLAGCGQTGKLFLRMPEVTFPPQAPLRMGQLTPIFLPSGVTLATPVSATRVSPAASTHAAPAAATRQP